MTWLLTVDPGKNGCGCALWYDGVLQKAAYVAPPVGQDIEALGRAALSTACEATARAVQDWTRAHTTDCYFSRDLRLVCELPRTYGGRAKKGDANDNVVPLAVVDGMIAGALGCPTALVWPQDWKGTIPKPETKKDYDRDGYIVEGRALAALTPEEKARIVWPSKGSWKLRMDVADALGIGLWHLKRMFR